MKSKRIHFLKTSLHLLLHKNKLAFFLYILLQVIISLGFVFFFTTIITSRENYLEDNNSMRQIIVNFNSTPSIHQVQEAIIQIQSYRTPLENINFEFSEIDIEGIKTSVYPYAELFPVRNFVNGGQSISCQIIERKEKVLIIGTYNSYAVQDSTIEDTNLLCYPNYQVGNKVKLAGSEFEIIGYRSAELTNYVEVPYTTGLECFSLQSLIITLPTGLSDQEKDNFGALILSLFPGARVETPPPMNQKVALNLILPLSTSVLVGLSAILSFLFLFQYMLESIRREYKIFHVCGASIKDLMTNLAAQLTLLFTLCFAVGTALFVLFRQIFITSELFKGTALHFSQVGIIYLASLFIILLMALPFLFRFRKQFRKGGGTG